MWSADFETITDPNDCRVWAWSVCGIDTPIVSVGNTIDGFMDFLYENGGSYYFHNLKFDGEFIFYWLFKHGYECVKKKPGQSIFKLPVKEKEFTCVVDGMGKLYSIRIVLENGKTVHIYDSYKIIPLPVESMPKSFGLVEQKLSIDYDEYREPGHQLTEQERAYVMNDVIIVAKALKMYFDQGLNKTTQAANAMADYKNIVGKDQFKHDFPQLVEDAELRQAYRGAWTYANKRYCGEDIGEGIVLDVNSLYPHVMHDRPCPYGHPIKFEGAYEYDECYPLWIAQVTFNFDLKEGHLPCLQLKNNWRFCPTEYLETDDDIEVTVTLTSVDWELLNEQYYITNVEFHHGWKFKSALNLFTKYVDKWMERKIQATKDENEGLRTIAKLMLNALYGKFGKNPKVENKYPYLSEEGIIKYTKMQAEMENPIYVPAAAFITAWARDKTVRAAQACYDRFLYADTDSLHLIGTEIPEGIEVDPYKLGAWGLEKTFTRARFLRAKTYIEEVKGKLEITCAGMPKQCYDQVTWENFHFEAVYEGKLVPKHVPGGIVLSETTFAISA